MTKDACLDAALDLVRRGIPVFICEEGGKRPAVKKGLKDATTDEAIVREWCKRNPKANLAVPTGAASGYIVVDIDVKKADGEAGFAAWVDGRELPPTFEVHTPSGGRHLWFMAPRGQRIKNSVEAVAPGVDVRGDGGYVLVPPSTIDGKAYKRKDSIKPAALPEWMQRALLEPQELERSTSSTVARFAEGKRNQELTRIGGSLRRVGLGSDELLAALSAVNESRCDPPLPQREVKTIAASVTRYEPAPDESYSWPDRLNIADLARREAPQPRMLMEGLPAGYCTSISGHGGAGKSSIALHLSVCLASGRDFCGLAVQQRRVLYLSCEDRTDTLHWRLRNICNYVRVDCGTLGERLSILDLVGVNSIIYVPDPRTGRALTAGFGALSAAVERYKAEVIVIDGIADAFGGNENSRTEVKGFVNSLLQLIPVERGAVLLVGHVNKLTARGPLTTEGYSGSTAWHNSVRSRWYFRPVAQDDEEDALQNADRAMVLELQKSNYGRVGIQIPFFWDLEQQVFVSRGVAAEEMVDRDTRNQRERNAILAAIRECVQRGQVVPAAHSGKGTAYNTLRVAAAFPDSLKSEPGRKRFWKHVQYLRHNNRIAEGSSLRPNRHSIATLVIAEGA